MNLPTASLAGASIVFLFGTQSTFGQLEIGESSCNATTYFAVRSSWASENEPCHQKLSLDMWAFMKAEGSTKDADAEHVYVECLLQPEMGLVELTTPKDWNSNVFDNSPGEILSETEHTATLSCEGAEDLEVICNDPEVTTAGRVLLAEDLIEPPSAIARRLQDATSEAAVVHKVGELIQGLQDLSCSRTTGEDQTLCVMSSSFDLGGTAAALQASGDLPDVEVIKEFPGASNNDRGAAMIETAFGIASGATYKFNTASLGQQAFADDILLLAGEEQCDVIVDNIAYSFEPSFHDGVIANAVDAATQDHNTLYFTGGTSLGTGLRFVSNFECQQDLFPGVTTAPCVAGVGAHVFDPADMATSRYFLEITLPFSFYVLLKWDEEGGVARGMTLALWQRSADNVFTNTAMVQSPAGVATVRVNLSANQQTFLSIHQGGIEPFAAMNMQLVSASNHLTGATSGSMFGHACATNALSVATIGYTSATGDDGAFADPEPAPVRSNSPRGPCIVADGQSFVERNHPVTTAADGLPTSTEGSNPLFGISASAPVAAAIATIIRAACFPRVVTYDDVMEMLTDYQYTIDATSDAGGAPETFGPEAGYGIISAEKMCLWVAQNCADACPGLAANVHGDPHLVGLAGQKFDFTGQSNSWYALLSVRDTDQVNMRVTAPIADLPGVTYITGISVQTEDKNGVEHSIIIFVTNPSVLDTSCPADGQPCIGDGALTVLLDGVSVTSPGKKQLGPGVSFAAANIPGECRPFGFERYWQQKVREAGLLAAQAGRRLSDIPTMDRWIAGDPSATNPNECEEYVSMAVEHDSLFTHQSDHVSFQLISPSLTLRLNHGKLHQLPERDPTDTFDIPDHTTFQMNLGFKGITRDDTMQGIIGETTVPTIDQHGAKIMSGLEAIGGQEEDYRVDGPLGKRFKQLITGI